MEILIALAAFATYAAMGFGLIYWAYRWAVRQALGTAARVALPTVVLIALWALPSLDHELGKREFDSLCETEAGTKIKRSISGVDGYRSRFASGNSPQQLGYQYVEEVKYDGTITRHTLESDKKIRSEVGVTPISRFSVDSKEISVDRQIIRIEFFVVDTGTNERIAEHIGFSHRGGWLARQFSSMFAYRAVCPAKPMALSAFIRAVLIPTGSKG